MTVLAFGERKDQNIFIFFKVYPASPNESKRIVLTVVVVLCNISDCFLCIFIITFDRKMGYN